MSFIHNRVRLFAIALIGAMLTAGSVFAADLDKTQAETVSELNYKAGLAYLLKDPAPAPGEKGIHFASIIHDSLFPRYDNALELSRIRDSYSMGLASRYQNGASNFAERPGENSVTERLYSESVAKEQTYFLMTRMALQVKAVAQIRDMLEPFSKPIEIYSGKDGGMSASFFGAKQGGQEAATRALGVNLAVSANNNLDVMLDIGQSWRLSYFDGSMLDLRYASPGSPHFFGFRTMGSEAFSLMYGVSF